MNILIVIIPITLVKVILALSDIKEIFVNSTTHAPITMHSNMRNFKTEEIGANGSMYGVNKINASLSLSNDTSRELKKSKRLVSKNNIKYIRKHINSTNDNEHKLRNNPKKKTKKKRGKVFIDSHEDALHLKLIDNMFFKNIDDGNSTSMVFSDESEITEDRVRQAIEDGGGSLAVVPLKRKKDLFKELLRWSHLHDKNERRLKIENEVFEKYKSKLPKNFTLKRTNKKFQLYPPVSVHKMFSENYTMILKKKTALDIHKNSTVILDNKNIYEHTNYPLNATQKRQLNNTQSHKPKKNNNYIKEESVEFQFDPEFQHKLYNTVKEKQKEHNKEKKAKKQKKKKKQAKQFDFNRPEISEEDYSAQENFVLNTQKEATGRRYYEVYLNKSASEFWDNNTRETTKMLEVLLPLGKHLHKTLDKVPPNEGKHFMADLELYKKELEKFIALVKQDKPETRPDVVELLEEPYDHVCETKYSEDEVKIMFDWDDEEFKHFEKVYQETREMWFDLQLFHHCYQFLSGSSESSWSLYNCTEADIYSNSSVVWNDKSK